jgi:hypothetical protein
MTPSLNSYLELHGCEFIILGSLFLGAILGFWQGYAHGCEHRYYNRRDASGKFVKRGAESAKRKLTWEAE